MINPEVSAILTQLTPFLVVAAGAVMVQLLRTPKANAFALAQSDKLAAETKSLVADADASNNGLLKEIVYQAMTYAEVHQDQVKKDFHTKAEYVIAMVQKDPRYGGFGVGLEEVEHILEVMWTHYFSDLQTPESKGPA